MTTRPQPCIYCKEPQIKRYTIYIRTEEGGKRKFKSIGLICENLLHITIKNQDTNQNEVYTLKKLF